jgi:hypothetical protein
MSVVCNQKDHMAGLVSLLTGAIDLRTFRFASADEVEGLRFGINVDTETAQDFGPTFLTPVNPGG